MTSPTEENVGETVSPQDRNSIRLARQLSINEWITLAVSLGSLAVAFASYRNSADNSDIRHAVKGLADLARQTKRQADIQSGQLALLKDQRPAVFRQAEAAADAAQAAKDTAAAARGQTGAILKQADAQIKSAAAIIGATTAQLRAAQAQLASAQANTKTAEAGARAANEQLRSATLLATTRVPFAKLSTLEINGWPPAPVDSIINITVKPSVSNAGGGALLPSFMTFNFIIGTEVPKVPPSQSQHTFGGNEVSIAPGMSYGPTLPFKYNVTKADIEAVSAGKKAIFIWGKIGYADTNGKQYTACYLDYVSAPTPEEPGGAVRPIDLDPYKCPIDADTRR